MLTADDMAMMRSTAEATLLTESCVVRSPGAKTSDGAGGWTEGAPSDSDAIDCSRRMPKPGNEMELANQLKLVNPWTIDLPAATAVDGEDQIVIGSDVYEVRALLEGGTREILLRVLCVESLI